MDKIINILQGIGDFFIAIVNALFLLLGFLYSYIDYVSSLVFYLPAELALFIILSISILVIKFLGGR